MAKLFLCGFLVLATFHLFSPWKLVIQRRSSSDMSSLGSDAANQIPAQENSGTKLQEQDRKVDFIESNFGSLEDAFIKSTREPAGPPRRSRDESIELIYHMESPSDWLDLVEGHDDHVRLRSLYFCTDPSDRAPRA